MIKSNYEKLLVFAEIVAHKSLCCWTFSFTENATISLYLQLYNVVNI